MGCIAPLCGMLHDARSGVVERTLDGLSLLLHAGRRRQQLAVVSREVGSGNCDIETTSDVHSVNPYLEEVGRAARERLLELHAHESESVAQKATRVSQEFFHDRAAAV
jgi:hypothetical protein